MDYKAKLLTSNKKKTTLSGDCLIFVLSGFQPKPKKKPEKRKREEPEEGKKKAAKKENGEYKFQVWIYKPGLEVINGECKFQVWVHKPGFEVINREYKFQVWTHKPRLEVINFFMLNWIKFQLLTKQKHLINRIRIGLKSTWI